MQPVLSAAQMARLDAYTIDSLGLDARLLMSAAANEVLRELREQWPDTRSLLVLVGPGNNGGDGLALSYLAQQRGLEVQVVLCIEPPEAAETAAERLSEIPGYFYELCRRAFVPIQPLGDPRLLPETINRCSPCVIVDALFGTGLSRELSNYYIALIERLNLSSAPKVAVDIPSGLHCDSGQPMGAAVRADLTVTFGHHKRGLLHPSALELVGNVQVAEIGFAPLAEAGIVPEGFYCPDALGRPLREPRKLDTHKGDYGKLLIVAGHRRYPGAPRLVAQAALRMGAGLTRLVVPEPAYPLCAADPGVMLDWHPADADGGFSAEPSAELLEYLDWADALVIGPGLGRGEALQLAHMLLDHRDLPTVVDADALSALHLDNKERRWPLLLTPHVGELARLAGVALEYARESWFELAQEQSQKYGALLLAKGAQCVLALPDGTLYWPHHGNPALAVGGSGDVLAGMLGALLARLHVLSVADATASQYMILPALVETALSAVNIHARMGELAAAHLGEICVTPTDLIEELPHALRELAAEHEP